jgi:hypothetical protein
MKTIISYTINAANPRLSDEEPDLLEQDERDQDGSPNSSEGWVPWGLEDLIDINRIIEERMPRKQREVIQAYLSGQNNKSLEVSEKYWRYHLEKAIKFIRKELGT